ncbi:hypothetical protein M0802_004724 [Mischocyttarus mexicanus]|nr:hypothetical protein M0802_004724 [Mischocyttarus mexicanus]
MISFGRSSTGCHQPLSVKPLGRITKSFNDSLAVAEGRKGRSFIKVPRQSKLAATTTGYFVVSSQWVN